jgi:outer membrane protein TolC
LDGLIFQSEHRLYPWRLRRVVNSPIPGSCRGLALAGCATGRLRPADTRLPMAFEAPVPAKTADMDLDRWWRLYDDPQLTELVEQALAHSPDARDAASKLEQARAVRARRPVCPIIRKALCRLRPPVSSWACWSRLRPSARPSAARR